MNAYPAELVVQLHACALVSGLVPEGIRERNAAIDTLPHPTAAHPALCEQVRCAMLRKARIWSLPGVATFRAVLVDYSYTYPPAKMRPPMRTANPIAKEALSSLPPRSPLSPLYVGGALFPDGIIAPSWIRKHTEYIPAVHIYFFCMPPAVDPALETDLALVQAMQDARAAAAPRGIRLVIVLLCEPSTLAQRELEPRLAHVRRAAGLEQRGALFVLSTATTDVPAFWASLERAVWDGAGEYYKERVRHVRRNRARYPPSPTVLQPLLAAAGVAGMLRPGPTATLTLNGWNIRTAFKLGAFSEMLGDVRETIVHYTEAYRVLMHHYLGNTHVLQPRTKRWAEAKVLADTLSLKLSKLHLYAANATAARAQFHYHTRHMSALGHAWRIGADSVEFWTWLAKQYQMLGELMVHAYAAHERTAHVYSALDPPGTLFYQAALCSMLPTQHARTHDLDPAPTQHLERAYDAFQQHKQTRLAHLAATRLAFLYLAAGQDAPAEKLIGRALRWYRREGWEVLRFVLLMSAAACARNDPRASTQYCIELLRPVPHALAAERDAWLAKLVHLLAPVHGATSGMIHMDPDAVHGLFDIHAVFAKQHAEVCTEVPFQVWIHGTYTEAMHLCSMEMYAHDADEPLFAVRIERGAKDAVDLGTVTVDAPCQAPVPAAFPGHLLLSGALTGTLPRTVAFARLVITAETSVGLVALPFHVPRPRAVWRLPNATVPISGSHTVHLREAHAIQVHAPLTMQCGERRAVRIDQSEAIQNTLLLLSPEAVEAGAQLGPSEDPARVELARGGEALLHAPQKPGTLQVRAYGLVPGEAAPVAQQDHAVHVAPAFSVRVHVHWLPLEAYGRLTTEVRYLGADPIHLDAVSVQAAGVYAHAVQGFTPAEWRTDDTSVWVTPLEANSAHASHNATLLLQWHGAYPGETRLALTPLAPPTAPDIAIAINNPAEAIVGAPAAVCIRVANRSDARVLDVLMECASTEAFLFAGARRKTLQVLLPGETRTVQWKLVPQHAGLLSLPALRAWEVQRGEKLLPLATPYPGTMCSTK
ncbi:hypothetical protein MVES_001226 [Malassezia vespertilionis]|uniref:Trafficking protein particle complex subunit 11 domain-containing protein n=1 Tax=Malassezia vespertilionis TaxID=2020962 RepID=A0A2N1JEV7_9BASI|nr:hypothetical protein MVES_001226 [Malassezia vespertilionis]